MPPPPLANLTMSPRVHATHTRTHTHMHTHTRTGSAICHSTSSSSSSSSAIYHLQLRQPSASAASARVPRDLEQQPATIPVSAVKVTDGLNKEQHNSTAAWPAQGAARPEQGTARWHGSLA